MTIFDEEHRTELYMEAEAALLRHGGNKAAAARELGIPVTTLKGRLSAWGDTRSPNATVTGRSTLYRSEEDGKVLLTWVKEKFNPSKDALLNAIKEEFDEYCGYAGSGWELTVETPDERLLNIYPIADHHLGMFSWGAETGTDYDLSIAKSILLGTAERLIRRSPAAKTALLLNVGDFFHSNDNSARTEMHGNQLDTDNRYAKVLRLGVALHLAMIDMLLDKHEKVIVAVLPGNHDEYAAIALTVALEAFYHDNPRVHVVNSPEPFFWFVFGKVFIAATHGHMVKPKDFPGFMAAYKPQEWGVTEFRYAYFGHIHHRELGGGDAYGVMTETFRTLAPPDAYHHAMGYANGRSILCITHDREGGEVARTVENIRRRE